MADRYWVGGTGTWNTTSTTNWSATSGGTGGASVPTIADNVIFNSSTTYTVTMTDAIACLSFTVSAGTVTFAQGTSPTLQVRGNMTLVSATVWNMTGNVTFDSTTSRTISTNNVNIKSTVIFDGIGGTWTLGSAFRCKDITLTAGTLSTSASNFSLTLTDRGFTISANSNVKTITLNGSTVSLGANSLLNNSTGNFTFNAGTSNINISGGGIGSFSIISPNQPITFYNYNNNSGLIYNLTFDGNFTFNDLNAIGTKFYTPYGYGFLRTWIITDTITVNGTLTINSGSTPDPTTRIAIVSNVRGTRRTITAGAVSLVDVDFRDIAGAGAATWSGTRIGDGGNNSNITFSTPKTVYYSSATLGSFYSSASAKWATTSGGVGVSTNFPLAQDTAIIDNNSGTGTLSQIGGGIDFEGSIRSYFYPTIDFSSRTTAMTLQADGGGASFTYATFYGNLILSSSVTVNVGSSGSSWIFERLGSQSINGGGTTIPTFQIVIDNIIGSTTLTGNLTTTAILTLTSGTLNLSTFTLTASAFVSDNSNTRSINFGTGKMSLSGAGGLYSSYIWYTATATNFTISGTPIVDVTYSGVNMNTHTGSSAESNSVSFNFTGGTYNLDLLGNTYRSLNFTGFSGSLTNRPISIYGNLVLSSGMTLNAGSSVMTFAATSGTNTITSAGKTLNFPVTFNGAGGTWQLNDNMTIYTTYILTHTNGTLNLNGKILNCRIYSVGAGTKNLTFNGGTLTIDGSGSTAFNNANPTGFTTTAGAGTGKISMTSASAKTFVGGGSTYNCTLAQAGAGTLSITGSNTFNDISNDYSATGPTQITFPASEVQTVSNFSAAGTSAKELTIDSSLAGTQATLSKSSGTISSQYLILKDSNATGGASWTTKNSRNNGNLTGWLLRSDAAFMAFF